MQILKVDFSGDVDTFTSEDYEVLLEVFWSVISSAASWGEKMRTWKMKFNLKNDNQKDGSALRQKQASVDSQAEIPLRLFFHLIDQF
jgi:hypothetical protein